MTQTNMHKILNDLKWQIEAGIDEVISDKPIVFSNEKNSRENKKIKNVSSKSLDQFQSINDLSNYFKNSIECELKDISKNSINIQGNLDSKIMIITNIPSPEEDKEGRVLVGENYDLFINILSSINLSLNDLCIAPIVPWKTPGERELKEDEIELLIPLIEKQIEIIKPKILILLGADPIKYLLKKDEGILSLRGNFINYKNNKINIICLPILAPDFLIRRPEYKRETWNDLLMFIEKIKELNLL